jgi:hypothetical protein
MSSCVFGFRDIDKTNIPVVGGKGANLGGPAHGSTSGGSVRALPLIP